MNVELAQGSVRSRRGRAAAPPGANGEVVNTNGEHAEDQEQVPQKAQQEQPIYKSAYNAKQASPAKGLSFQRDSLLLLFLTVGALVTRFYKIWHPDQVVFDEVHFGKFAAFYIRREYFFDVHPPFAKLLLAFAGWLAGFKGDFEFENIGDKYVAAGVPYIKMRALPAILGATQVPLVYAIMRQTGHAPTIAAFSALLLLFDNAHITQDRLILLDAALVFFVTFSLFSYVMFYKQRYNEFSFRWWAWMFVTGFSLATTMSCKMVGLLTIMSVGTAVVFDFWNIMDIKRGISMQHIGRHFLARTFGLIIFPAFVYLFWFWVHFAILIKSGPGDAFMTSEFQQTLQGNPMLAQARDIHWFDKIAMQHKGTSAYLHSHTEKYPLKYDDGRISSQGQQVTGYPFNDTNNIWQLVPANEHSYEGESFDMKNELHRPIRHKNVVRLLHVNTQTYLMAHDVASPLMPTNEEVTTWPANDSTRYEDTLFEFQLDGKGDGTKWKSKSGWFRLIHVPTRVSVWTHTETPLPEWGFNQQEVNGNKNALDKSAVWFVDELYPDETQDDYEERIKPIAPRPVTKMPFYKKFVELQLQMLQQNAHLTQSHPYASSPINWPFVLTGISFWTDNDTQRQIYLVGNVASWWVAVLSISVVTGIMLADTLARRRGQYPIEPLVRNRLFNATGFFLIAWAWHYLPFFLMNRQLFLHHYLPAHVIGCLVAGSVLNFVGSETIDAPASNPGGLLYTRGFAAPRQNIVPRGVKAAAGVIIGVVVVVFWHLAPLTYGDRTLTQDEVEARKWLQWSLHFAK
ncbi:putative PMT4-dolichyl-phosphate-mannose--protein O-mannosyltransferase [Meira miltonrushii]|uniref:Dolichyl-phosphate-mannose--protein mannosyltransferase n=1 Tax=Meira miltonrushii TaxID=1280837 RepID=A0A316V926_9BASI|nr:putative PMT4-dolichyl-phosphate-mannose--protein O-mannosyltransferase [Meira miltonrushii]PWN31975.1 putative PMT4-dolichyl-phosphate-mannose--protein O-mannosyltransferase [Meira miltonrushii]